MISNKAQALGYEKNVDTKDKHQLAALLTWLEADVLPVFAKDDPNKQFLQDANCPQWTESVSQYAQKLLAPVSLTSPESQIEWILSCAIQSAYKRKSEEYNKFAVSNLKSSNVPNVTVDNALDHLDFSSNEFSEGVKKLAKILNMPTHTDNTVVLKACATIIETRLHKDALEHSEKYIVKGHPFPYKDVNPGFELQDDALIEAAKILRLIYISDLRDLQTKINECIVAVQSVTANPKTDTKLGQIGK